MNLTAYGILYCKIIDYRHFWAEAKSQTLTLESTKSNLSSLDDMRLLRLPWMKLRAEKGSGILDMAQKTAYIYLLIKFQLICVIKCKQINSTYDSDISASTSSACSVCGIQFVQVCLWNYNKWVLSQIQQPRSADYLRKLHICCFLFRWVYFILSFQLGKIEILYNWKSLP